MPGDLPAPTGAAPTPMARRFSLCGATAAVAGAAVACLLAPRGSEVMRSLHDELAAIEDFRRAGSTRCAHVLAELANMKGCLAAARSLSRDELGAIGRTRGRGCASRPPGRPSTGSSGRSTPRRSRMCSAAGSPGRLPPTASASAAPTATTRPWPSRLWRTLRAVELRRRRAGGHLLERTDVRGKVITRTTPATLITRRCGADHVFPVKGARNLRLGASGRFKEARPASSSACRSRA